MKGNTEAQRQLVGEHVSIYLRGKTWYANFQSGKRQNRISLKTKSKKEALLRALKIETKVATSQWQKAVEPTKVADAVAAYITHCQAEGRSAKTLNKYKRVLDQVKELAHRRRVVQLAGLDLSFVDAYRQFRFEESAAKVTVFHETVIIRQLILFAISRNMIECDPLRQLKNPRPRPTRQPCWTQDQVERVLAAAPTAYLAAFIVLADTGMRIGELSWLTPADADLKNNLIHIREKAGWKPKSGDCRSIPMSKRVRQVLEKMWFGGPWLFPQPTRSGKSRSTRQLSERCALIVLKKVLSDLKLEGKLHTFRHAFISNALLKKVAPAIVRSWVGHVDDKIMALYTHVHDSASQFAMSELSMANQRAGQGGPDSAQFQHS